MGGFISGIKMYAYADEHTPERKMISSAYFQMLQAVIIQHAVIDPFAGSTFTVDGFVLLGIPGDTGMKAQVSMVFYVDSPPITAGGTFYFIRARADTPTSEGDSGIYVHLCKGHFLMGTFHALLGKADGLPC